MLHYFWSWRWLYKRVMNCRSVSGNDCECTTICSPIWRSHRGDISIGCDVTAAAVLPNLLSEVDLDRNKSVICWFSSGLWFIKVLTLGIFLVIVVCNVCYKRIVTIDISIQYTVVCIQYTVYSILYTDNKQWHMHWCYYQLHRIGDHGLT